MDIQHSHIICMEEWSGGKGWKINGQMSITKRQPPIFPTCRIYIHEKLLPSIVEKLIITSFKGATWVGPVWSGIDLIFDPQHSSSQEFDI